MPNIIDLSHFIESKMSVYPETPQPRVAEQITIANEGFTESEISMYNHIGTHIDTPAHIIPGGKNLNDYQISEFYGKACLVNCCNEQYICETLIIEAIRNRNVDVLIFRSDHSKHWKTPLYFTNYPVLTEGAINTIIKNNIKAVGIDAISFDLVDNTELSNHHKLLSNDIILIENLTNLYKLNKDTFDICFFPLKFKNLDASPVRAVAIIN